DGVEFRVVETFKLPNEALNQAEKTVDGFKFYSAPDDVLLNMFRALIERYIEHYNKPEPPKEDSRHIIDAKAVFPKEEIDDYIKRFTEKANLVKTKTS
ncbi:MAG TPA: hypothetical protein VJJ72_03055, partial [Candidatus Paceibacterota bacterium]